MLGSVCIVLRMKVMVIIIMMMMVDVTGILTLYPSPW